jgi:hypothetical protein
MDDRGDHCDCDQPVEFRLAPPPMYLGIRSVLPACSQPALRMPGAPRASLHQNGSIAIRHQRVTCNKKGTLYNFYVSGLTTFFEQHSANRPLRESKKPRLERPRTISNVHSAAAISMHATTGRCSIIKPLPHPAQDRARVPCVIVRCAPVQLSRGPQFCRQETRRHLHRINVDCLLPAPYKADVK